MVRQRHFKLRIQTRETETNKPIRAKDVLGAEQDFRLPANRRVSGLVEALALCQNAGCVATEHGLLLYGHSEEELEEWRNRE